MGQKLLKLTKGQNIRLATISAHIAALIGKYLYDGTKAEKDEIVLEKAREYFKYVKKGLDFKNNERGLSFDPETVHSINALDEVYLITHDINKVLENIEETFCVIEGKKEQSDITIIERSFNFFTELTDKVSKSNYIPEASHAL